MAVGRGDAVLEEHRGLVVRFPQLGHPDVDRLVAVVQRQDAVARIAADLAVGSELRVPDPLVEAHLSRQAQSGSAWSSQATTPATTSARLVSLKTSCLAPG